MTYRQHVLFAWGVFFAIPLVAALVSSSIVYYFTTSHWFTGMTASAIFLGAVFPDIDHPEAYISNVWRRFAFFADFLSIAIILLFHSSRLSAQYAFLHTGSILTLAATVVIWAVRRFSGHRGVTHTLIVPIVLCSGLAGFVYYGLSRPTWFVWWFLFGWVMHVAGDLFTPSGVPILWPVSSRRLMVSSNPTRSGIARSAVLIASAGSVGLFVFQFVF